MLSAPQSEKEPNRTEFASNAVSIRQQLKRLLAHPLFTNSKRYPVLLAYTVEQALLGNASELKERTIGVEAFGGRPDYDVNLDPVVRTTAAEVRKRLTSTTTMQTTRGNWSSNCQLVRIFPCFENSILIRTFKSTPPWSPSHVKPCCKVRRTQKGLCMIPLIRPQAG